VTGWRALVAAAGVLLVCGLLLSSGWSNGYVAQDRSLQRLAEASRDAQQGVWSVAMPKQQHAILHEHASTWISPMNAALFVWFEQRASTSAARSQHVAGWCLHLLMLAFVLGVIWRAAGRRFYTAPLLLAFAWGVHPALSIVPYFVSARAFALMSVALALAFGLLFWGRFRGASILATILLCFAVVAHWQASLAVFAATVSWLFWVRTAPDSVVRLSSISRGLVVWLLISLVYLWWQELPHLLPTSGGQLESQGDLALAVLRLPDLTWLALRQLVLPQQLFLHHLHEYYLTVPAWRLGLSAALLAAGLVLLYRVSGRRLSWVVMTICWGLLLLPAGYVSTLRAPLGLNQFLYLPALGLLLMAVVGMVRLMSQNDDGLWRWRLRRGLIIGLLVWSGIFSAGTYQASSGWHDEVAGCRWYTR